MFTAGPGFFGGSSYRNVILADSPLYYWPLNESSGTTATDIVGGHNGTYPAGVLNGQTAIYSNLGTSYSLPGTSPNFITFTPAAISTSITVEGWILPNGTTTSNLVAINNNGGIRIQVYTTVAIIFGGAAKLTAPAGSITGSTKYHLVITAGASGCAIYINGTSVATTAAAWSSSPSTTSYIGSNSTSEILNGKLSNVAIYNSILNSTQILNHYNAGI